MSKGAGKKNEEKEKGESRVKRDFLREIEVAVQKKWENEKIFEVDADEVASPKYMGTFPYPYMNGRMHLGHTFTLTKVEFAVNYERLKGKRCLFPFGFHCTGMPIKACADKLAREMEKFGNPPKFPEVIEEEKTEAKEEKDKKSGDPTQFHAKKSKVQAKSSGEVYQWNIMKSLGVPEEEIPLFANAEHWLGYFPPHCKTDLQGMGLGVDWRRSFITTETNPYYDSFVRWQFETLRDRGKVLFGKRHSIFSPLDNQPCADHDRASGEGVLPQDYTLIKLELVPPFPPALQSLEGSTVSLLAATLRPETMYGQTNCWILPEGEYGAFATSNPKEVFVVTPRAARNLAFQGHSPVPGKVECLLPLKGWDLLGLPLKAPLSKYPVVYTLPMLTISPEKGTGIVTSVPSDSPDDYINLEELKRKQPFREKFHLKDHMVLPYETVPIITIPTLGDRAAETVCKELKIKSPNDRVLLETAKDRVYQLGFSQGVMAVGEFKGRPVQEAKPLLRDALVAANEALLYSEPASKVISRSGDECVVAFADQWFLNYGEAQWRAQVEEHLAKMELYSPDTRHRFELTLGWLNQWACSRSYGLGTKLPWDPQYLIESLSDSTIYMSYYTVAHLLQGGVIDGSAVGPAGIKPEQLTREVWDYIFLKGAYPSSCGIPEETLKQLRAEFEYWYPLDLRVSGKDLIPNHLTFSLYSHIAVWPEPMGPRAFRANGHILLNNEKMSKSTGNFMTLSEAVGEYSADGMRIALADAGDSLDDANFSTSTADNAVLRLYTQIHWTEEALSKLSLMRDGPPDTFDDRVFASLISVCIRSTDQHYSRTNFRDALRSGFFDLQSARDNYRVAVGSWEQMNRQLIERFLHVQTILLAPIAPHFSQHLWALLGHSDCIQNARWPEEGEVDEVLLRQHAYLQTAVHTFRLKKEAHMKPKPKKGQTPVTLPPPTKAVIHVIQHYPEWVQKTLTLITPLFQGKKEAPETNVVMATLSQDPELKKMLKNVMPLVATVKEDFKEQGMSALDLSLPFDERECLQQNSDFIRKSLELEELEIVYAAEDGNQKGKPGKPFIVFA